MVAEVRTEPTFELVSQPELLFGASLTPTLRVGPSDQRFLLAREIERPRVTELHVIENWLSELERLTPRQ